MLRLPTGIRTRWRRVRRVVLARRRLLAALVAAGADHLAPLDTILSTQYSGGIDLSGGEWQRVALARAVCAVRRGAGVVLLDEPTAQLDVRGEAQIFRRLLEATRGVTTILVSHRFSTVRHVDRICVVEDGRVVETGLNAARVLLLVDPDSIVPVRRTRDGLPAIVAGRGDGAVDIRSVDDLGVRFTAGDLFVTSGTGGLYAPGVPVARVDRAGSDTVQARPYAPPDTLDVAFVERPFMPIPVYPAR